MIWDVVCLASMPRDHSIILSFVKNKIVHRAYANEIVIDITAGTEHNVKPRKMASSRLQRADPENSILVGVLTTFVLDINVVFQKGPYGTPSRMEVRTSISKETYSHLLFSRGLGPPATPPPSGPTHGQLQCKGATPQYNAPQTESLRSLKVSNGAKIRNRYNQVPHLTQDTNGKVTNSQKTPQTRAKRSALSQQVTTKHI